MDNLPTNHFMLAFERNFISQYRATSASYPLAKEIHDGIVHYKEYHVSVLFDAFLKGYLYYFETNVKGNTNE